METSEGSQLASIETSYSPGNNNCYVTRKLRSQQKSDSYCEESQSPMDPSNTRSTSFVTCKNDKSNKWLDCLLGAALFTSLLNILLLSFVIKSIQLNDSTMLTDLLTNVHARHKSTTNSSLSLNTIQSFGDKPLRLVAWPAVKVPELPDELKTESTVFISNLPVTDGNFKPNYMAVNNVNNNDVNGGGSKLEIGAKLFTLSLINKSNNRTGKRSSDRVVTNGKLSTDMEAKTLLKLDGHQQTIMLPLEDELNLDSMTASSLTINEKLESSHILGSMKDHLNLQTRGGNLSCTSEDTLKLVARSGTIRVATSHDLALSAASIMFGAAKNLLIPQGIHYLDSESPYLDAYEETKASSDDLRAYNLVAINGILAAS